MAKLRVLSGSAVCGILEEQGFIRLRQRGSHTSMQRTVAGSTTTVPVPLHNELKVGTLLAIIRQSGLPRALFE